MRKIMGVLDGTTRMPDSGANPTPR